MPVELKELVIRASVDSDEQSPKKATHALSLPAARDEIVEAAVREVVRILRASKDR